MFARIDLEPFRETCSDKVVIEYQSLAILNNRITHLTRPLLILI